MLRKFITYIISQTRLFIQREFKLSYCCIALASSIFLAFGVYNVHSLSGITEGGLLGLSLLLEHWFGISPSQSSLLFNLVCYFFGWKLLGRRFVFYSALASLGFSAGYHFFEGFEPLFPRIAEIPLLAAIVGAVFVGVGSGFCVRIGSATSGDDALALGFAKLTKVDIFWIYLLSDLIVLALSLSYIPAQHLMYSLLTVIISGQIVSQIQDFELPKAWP